jgi:glycosyltransferase involved in cell wall biosynthesis
MACGKAIVTTPVGCAGLGLTDGREALIRTGPAEFAAGLCEVLASPSLRERLAGAARDTAERRYSWSAIATEAERSYRALVQQAPRALAASPTLAAAVAGALPDLPF